MEDAAGKQLSRQYFDVSFYTQSNPPVKTNVASLAVTVSLPEKPAGIRILQVEKELYSTKVSANKPEVEITSITEDGQKLDGRQTIEWTGSDPDGDKLYYELWYCTEGGDFTAVASNITETSFEVDFGKLPGSKAGYFYLYATDGVDTGECSSYEIQVPYKAPEIISEQKTIPGYKLTDEIVFDADVYDMQDGWLYSDAEISWSYNGRDYTTGSLLWVYPFELTPGKHEFTMTATNSEGVSSSRWDALSALLDLIKGYAENEYKTLSKTIKARRPITAESPARDAAEQDNWLTGAMSRIMAVAEQYPDLKANQQYSKTMDNMNPYEGMVRQSRLSYNDSVTKLNRRIRMFPTALVAGMMGFHRRDYLETFHRK